MTPQELCNQLKNKLDVDFIHLDISFSTDREPMYYIYDGDDFELHHATLSELKEYIRSLHE